MGFPDSFRLDASSHAKEYIYHELGNAVVPAVITAIGREMIAALGITAGRAPASMEYTST
jgi:site-specific DNA-cytosine methylase